MAACVPLAAAEGRADLTEAYAKSCVGLLNEAFRHGFRKVENISRGLSAELTFYGTILGFEPADRLPALEIENLPSDGD